MCAEELTTLGQQLPFLCMVLSPIEKVQGASIKSGIWSMMLASIVEPIGAIGCTDGTQNTFPVVPKHTLGCYFRFFCVPTVHTGEVPL